jgi:hypothetical protein
LTARAASAQPFNQCPAIGFSNSCAILFTVNPDGSITAASDPSVPPFDGVEDTLVGVQNNSAGTLLSLTLSGAGIFGFDADGLCSGVNSSGGAGFVPPPAACPFGPTGYEGPGTSFSIVDANNGTVLFAGSGVGPGQSTYFSLEGSPSAQSFVIEQPIIAQPTTFSATEGVSFSGAVATATDADPKSTAAEYTATIQWGDASTSTGTISGPTGGPFTISGTHTYAEDGIYSVTVTITDIDTGANTSTVTSRANVADSPLAARCATPATSLLSFSGSVATFTDGNPGATSSDFTAIVDWGDASNSAGTISGPTGGPFTVSGSHVYSSTGDHTISVSIVDAGGSAATASGCTELTYTFAPSGGSFVIGDEDSANGTAVTFWGAKWAKLNSLSGGPAPNQFKGFANNPGAPACGLDWSSHPGDSDPPPAGPLPAFMAVIVTSSASSSGSLISGDTAKIVIVQTNPGYDPDPGHAGTGTVVAQLCQ